MQTSVGDPYRFEERAHGVQDSDEDRGGSRSAARGEPFGQA